MVINTNIASLTSARMLENSQTMLSQSLERLSSGSKIISPADDAAGLAMSIHFTARINRISAATNNVANALSFSQTQDGFLQQVQSALDRMSQLSILAQDSTKTTTDLSAYNSEFQTLSNYITDVATKDFNGVSLFNGTTQQVTTDSEGTKFGMAGINLGASVYTTATAGNVSTSSAAATALTNVEAAITQLAQDRATVGASETRLNDTTSQLNVLSDNLSAANSQIKDVNVATESAQFARYNILVQAGTAMLAQANALPQSVLKLIGSRSGGRSGSVSSRTARVRRPSFFCLRPAVRPPINRWAAWRPHRACQQMMGDEHELRHIEHRFHEPEHADLWDLGLRELQQQRQHQFGGGGVGFWL